MCNLNFLLKTMRWHAKGPNLLSLPGLNCERWRRCPQSRGTAVFVAISAWAGQWAEGGWPSHTGRDWRSHPRDPYPRQHLPKPSRPLGLLQAGCAGRRMHVQRTLWSCSVIPGQLEMVLQEFHSLPELGSQLCWCGSWTLFCNQISFFLLCSLLN